MILNSIYFLLMSPTTTLDILLQRRGNQFLKKGFYGLKYIKKCFLTGVVLRYGRCLEIMGNQNINALELRLKGILILYSTI